MQVRSKVSFLLFALRKGREGGATCSGPTHCSGPASVVLGSHIVPRELFWVHKQRLLENL